MNRRKSCHIVALMMALFLWFQGSIATTGFSDQALDLGYSKELIRCLSGLSPAERDTILKKPISQNLSNLVELFLNDKIISSNESKFIALVQKQYGKEKISQNQAKFFSFLSTIPGHEKFFSYHLSKEEIESLPLVNDILDTVEIEVYQRNDSNIPIIMYHTTDGSITGISKESFLSHLDLLDAGGFTSLSLEHYYQGDFSQIPQGRKPVILTFDDGWNSQFSYLNQENTLIDPNCSVGLLNDFAKLHPLFGKNAIFFPYLRILPFTLSINKYRQSEVWKKKIQYLQENGFEIGCHTYNHAYLHKTTDQVIKKELDSFFEKIKTAIEKPISSVMFFAYPGGHYPKNMKTIENYTFQGVPLKLSLTAFGGMAKIPFRLNPDIHKIKRVIGEDYHLKQAIGQPSFAKFGYKISLPKLFISNDKLLRRWITENTSYKTRYLLSDPTILFALLSK